MKIAIASDLHLGDITCSLASFDRAGVVQLGPKYAEFKDAVADSDYLVLVGDVLDFSVANYDTAFAAAQLFFTQLNRDGVTKQIVYVPGNHDYTLWTTVLQQANVINPIAAHGAPRRRWTVPGILDFQTGKLLLAGVSPDPAGNYGGLFLDELSRIGAAAPATPITFNVVYPNLYLVPAPGESILVTHGHYFDAYWSFLREFARKIARTDLRLLGGAQPDVADYVALNLPLNELASASIGQSAGLSDIARAIQKEVKAGDLTRVTLYMNRLVAYLDSLIKFDGVFSPLKEYLSDKCLEAVRDFALKGLTSYPDHAPRYRTDYLKSADVQARVRGYLDACLLEMSFTQACTGVTLSQPSTVLFGHTHDPLPLNVTPAMQLVHWGKCIRFYNTGGWLKDETAIVFRYESGAAPSCVVVPC
ncbi:MAG: metallophosphoesterase [Deltaproteobacteria bacterium]|nr:metallophosphoesterase [Deltaproteobacteria bacterium]